MELPCKYCGLVSKPTACGIYARWKRGNFKKGAEEMGSGCMALDEYRVVSKQKRR
jgi:hypothetical protein